MESMDRSARAAAGFTTTRCHWTRWRTSSRCPIIRASKILTYFDCCVGEKLIYCGWEINFIVCQIYANCFCVILLFWHLTMGDRAIAGRSPVHKQSKFILCSIPRSGCGMLDSNRIIGWALFTTEFRISIKTLRMVLVLVVLNSYSPWQTETEKHLSKEEQEEVDKYPKSDTNGMENRDTDAPCCCRAFGWFWTEQWIRNQFYV